MKDADEKGHALAKRLRKDMPDAEYALWRELRRKQLGGFHFRRQLPVGPYVVDFSCVKEKLIIEVDGVGHSEADEMARDIKRTDFLNGLGWQVMRFHNEEIYQNLEAVLAHTYASLTGETDE